MNRADIETVRAQALRVAALCTDAKHELDAEGSRSYIAGTKTSGALRRASLDLTRSLAEMRKP